MNHRFIAIEGNIGAGKTTLATMLAREWNARLMLEQFAENPFLPLFYENPEKYAFALELSFLGERFEQMKKELTTPNLFQPLVISDYYIIKSLLFANINLGEAEYKLFERLFHIIYDSFPKPDLVVYLNSDIDRLQANIRSRGRSYEQNIENTYLEKLHEKYIESFKSMQDVPVLVFNTTTKDFVSNSLTFRKITNKLSETYPSGIHLIDIE